MVVHERRSRCPHWWCTSDAADAHYMMVHERADSTIQVGIQPMPTLTSDAAYAHTDGARATQPMPTLMVHERHSRCPPYAGARASRQYDTGWYTADAHTDVHERRSRCPHWWCTSDAADAQSDTADAHHMLVHERANIKGLAHAAPSTHLCASASCSVLCLSSE